MTRIKLSENFTIPIFWVGCAYLPTTAFVIAIALWVYKVDLRLQRIEDKMGLKPLPAEVALALPEARANE